MFVDHVVELHGDGVLVAHIAYDLLPVVTPQYCGHSTERLANYVQNVYPICDTILAISEHTKRDIASWLDRERTARPEDRRVPSRRRLHPRRRRGSRRTCRFSTAYNRNTHFLLCVGTIEVRKNHALLYYTYKLAHEQHIELPPIVIVGRRSWLSDDLYEVMTHDPQTKAKFVFLHDASDEELAWLYRHCQFSVYPSFYEGWGLPIGESLANGVPCVASRSSSMPEVAGELIPYFSPASADECLQAITAMLRPGSLDEAKRTISSYQPARWDDTFETVRNSVQALRKNSVNAVALASGGRGIRTLGDLRLNGFQDRPVRPLRHPSERQATASAIHWRVAFAQRKSRCSESGVRGRSCAHVPRWPRIPNFGERSGDASGRDPWGP